MKLKGRIGQAFAVLGAALAVLVLAAVAPREEKRKDSAPVPAVEQPEMNPPDAAAPATNPTHTRDEDAPETPPSPHSSPQSTAHQDQRAQEKGAAPAESGRRPGRIINTCAPGSMTSRVAVMPGETLKAFALRVYGRAEIASLLERAGAPRRPATGQLIEIPMAREIRMPRGSSLSQLARKYLGDGRRWPILAAFSGIEDTTRCGAGRKILVPAMMRLQIRSGDSLSKLAQLAWGDPRGGDLIALWNNQPAGSWLSKGHRIEIPLPGPLSSELSASAHDLELPGTTLRASARR